MRENPISHLLSRARRARGLSRAQVAEAAGVHRVTVTIWETGDHLPSLPKLRTVADAYQLNADERAELASLLLGEAPAGAA